MDPPVDAGRPPARLDETGRYRLSPDIPAEGLVRRYRQQLALIVAPLLLLLLVLAAWQLWQARGAAVADLERQATQQAASLQLLARTVSEHVADLRWQAERALAPGAAGSPDAALLQALQPRAATGAGIDGYALDALPPLLHAGSAQWVWSRPEAPGADALAASQVLGRVAEVAHARHPELAGSRWVAWPERWVAGYPFEPSSALFERWKAGSAAELLARLMADEAFSAGRPQENPQRVTYWTGIRTPNMGEAPQIEHAAPVYDGDEFRGVVSTRIRLETIARAAAAALKGQAAAPWWVLSARGELLAAHEARSPAPTLQAADLASMRQAGGRAGGYGGLRAVAIDTPDAPWTLVVARTDAALLAQALPGLLPFALMALGLFGLFLQAQSLLRRRLIEPALGVMGYLHDKSVDPSTPEPDLPARWRPWARVVTRAIDEQRDARAAERRSEALKSAIVDHALAALVATDAQGRIVEFNPAAEAMFGHRRASVLGKAASEVIVPARHRAAHDAGLRRAAAGGPTRLLGRRVEMNALRSDGSEFPVEMLLWRADVAGAALFTASLVDLSERRRAATEIERQREALRQAEKLSAMGGLLAGVAHELNNPLAIVQGRAALLEEKAAAHPDLHADAQRIRDAAERCGRIVRTFLNMARSRPTQRAPVAFNDMVRAAAEMLAYTWRSHGIELELDLADDLPHVNADADQIGQVVLNLLINAQQALMAHQGERKVRLSTGMEPMRAGRQPRVWLRVADSGPGVDEQAAERIFEPYFTTKTSDAGTGIGLAMSRSLVRDHGGNLALESVRPLGGACFRLSLPLSGEAGPETAAMHLADGGAGAAQARVLVVDDEPQVAELMRDMLETAGHEVAVAESAAVALELLDTARFDAIVSDLRMPDMDGAQLWQQVNRSHPGLTRRMLFITGDTLSETSQQFLVQSGCPRLDKPFSKADLVSAVTAVLA